MEVSLSEIVALFFVHYAPRTYNRFRGCFDMAGVGKNGFIFLSFFMPIPFVFRLYKCKQTKNTKP